MIQLKEKERLLRSAKAPMIDKIHAIDAVQILLEEKRNNVQ